MIVLWQLDKLPNGTRTDAHRVRSLWRTVVAACLQEPGEWVYRSVGSWRSECYQRTWKSQVSWCYRKQTCMLQKGRCVVSRCVFLNLDSTKSLKRFATHRDSHHVFLMKGMPSWSSHWWLRTASMSSRRLIPTTRNLQVCFQLALVTYCTCTILYGRSYLVGI